MIFFDTPKGGYAKFPFADRALLYTRADFRA
jgi:hypothetical protein